MPSKWILIALVVCCSVCKLQAADVKKEDGILRKTVVSIEGEKFKINEQSTYPGRVYMGIRVEGLLMNSRMVQATFDDANPETQTLWRYSDGPWDAERNVREFIAAMPEWKRHGLLAITVNFQGGSPQGYSAAQRWQNSGFTWDGELKPEYVTRMKRVIDAADDLGMVVILGYFYFGQEPRMHGEQAIIAATDAATDWVLDQHYTNVVIEIANESDIIYKHAIIKSGRGNELIERVQKRSAGKVNNPVGRLLVSTSFGGGHIPGSEVAKVADFMLIHGNGVAEPKGIEDLIVKTRAIKTYHGQPIVINEDDHFDFDKSDNNLLAALRQNVSWGYFDFRKNAEGFDEGYQSVPVNWQISSNRKKGFFNLLKQITATTEALPGGGPMTHVRYAGTATIVRVKKTDASNANRGIAAEGYEVWFTFAPTRQVEEQLGKNYLARFKEHPFVLCNGWNPGPKYLKKYGIDKGKEFACTLIVQTQGTGTPVMLQLDDVPNTDYFEAAGGEKKP